MKPLALLLLVTACSTEPSPLDRVTPPALQRDYCRASGAYQVWQPLGAQQGSEVRPGHTFSIVARDPATGDLGVAVQSHWFSVGSMVTWAEPGVGAIATQSFVEPSYGPKGLALMRGGMSAPDAMNQLIAADPGAAGRQLGFVDAHGRAASFTGAHDIGYASSHVGDGYATQSNLMANDRVTLAMAVAYEHATGDLADRLMAALDAGQAVGGDIRGCQSAAILVVSGKQSDTPWAEKKLDLRVEDSPAPIAELHRLVTLARAFDEMNRGDAATEQGDLAAAVRHYGAAARAVPDNAEMIYWQAVSLADHGKVDEAMPLFRRAIAADPAWAELTRRLPAAGLLHDQRVVERVQQLRP